MLDRWPDAVPFGTFQPLLGGAIPMHPPPALIEPPVEEVIFDYAGLRQYRMWNQPYFIVVHYDSVQDMIEARIEEIKEQHWQQWLQWVENNL